MNKADFIGEIASRSGLSKRASELAINAALETIGDLLAAGEKIQFVGFGTFEVKSRAGRTGRNPKTNEAVMIPPAKSPVFKAGKVLKEKVSG